MRRAVFYSAGLHVVVVMVAYLGIPAMLSKPVVQDVPLPVELVALEEFMKKAPPPPKPKPVKKKAPPPPPPEAKPEPPPPPVAVPAPEPPPPPKAKPKPKPKEKAKPKPKSKKPPPVRQAKVAPKPKPKPKRLDQMRMILKDLAKRKEVRREQEKKQAMVLDPLPRVLRPAAPVRTSIDQRLQAQKLTALVKQQLAPCWSIPGGVKDAHTLKVAVEIRLNTDGKLRGAPRVLDTNRMRTDPAFRVVAESAVRALHKCSPLKLPYDQYNLWQNITFNFDPSEALGQ